MKAWVGLAKQTFKDFGEDGVTRLAAALSYYTIFSLPPLLMLLLLLLGIVMDRADVEALLSGQLGSLLGPGTEEQIGEIMKNADDPDMSRATAAVTGIAALIFGATGAFVELQNALNRIWEVEPDPRKGGIRNFLVKRLFSFGMLLTIAFLLIVSLAVSAVLAAMGDRLAAFLPDAVSGVLLQVANGVLSLAVLGVLFAFMFKYLPDAVVRWKDVWVGGLVTAALFTAGKFGIGLYLGRSDPGGAFGAAGSLALLLVWIYYSAVILFLGAEFTQAWAVRRGAGIRPEPGAVRIVETKRIVSRGEAAG